MSRERQGLRQEQENELLNAYTQSQDGALRTRYQAVRLYGLGYPVEEIVTISGCSVTSLNRWWQLYRTEGIAGLVDSRSGGNCAKLTPAQLLDLNDKLHRYNPAQVFGPVVATTDGQFWTVADLGHGLQQWYGVIYQSVTSYGTLFKRCGFSYQRTEKVYRSRSEAKVVAFEETMEKKRLTWR